MFTNQRTQWTGPAAIAAAATVTLSAVAGGPCLSNELSKVTAADAASGDEFGVSVSNSGSFGVVGSWRAVVDGMSQHGAAYVYKNNGTSWAPVVKLTDNDGNSFDRFGRSVSLDGDTIAVGSHFDDVPLSKSGSTIVFTNQGGSWMQVAKISPLDAALGDEFGWSVAVSGDTLVVGAHFDGDGAMIGSAYVFERNAGGWIDMTETTKLTASDAALGDEFGRAVGVNGDTVIVGAFRDDDGGSASGSVYCFDYSGSWTESKLNAPDAAFGDYFGWSVAIGDELAVVGAYLDDDMGSASGSGYVYRNVGGTWTYQAKLQASDGAGDANFGFAVSVGDDVAFVGSHHDGNAGPNTGAAYAFGGLSDCNANGLVDMCDLLNGTSFDDNGDGVLDECQASECSADLDGSGSVDIIDFLDLLAAWGPNPGHPADLDGDDAVGISDFLMLLGAWGPCP